MNTKQQINGKRIQKAPIEVPSISFHVKKLEVSQRNQRKRDEPITTPTKQIEEHDQNDNEIEEVQCQIAVSQLPWRLRDLRIVAKFCYGIKIEVVELYEVGEIGACVVVGVWAGEGGGVAYCFSSLPLLFLPFFSFLFLTEMPLKK